MHIVSLSTSQECAISSGIVQFFLQGAATTDEKIVTLWPFPVPQLLQKGMKS